MHPSYSCYVKKTSYKWWNIVQVFLFWVSVCSVRFVELCSLQVVLCGFEIAHVQVSVHDLNPTLTINLAITLTYTFVNPNHNPNPKP